MPDSRKHIVVEPESHKEFMDLAKEFDKTQDSGLIYLTRFHKSVRKADIDLFNKIHFNLS